MSEQMLAEVFALAWRAELRRLAEAATPGPWWLNGGEPWAGDEAMTKALDAESAAAGNDHWPDELAERWLEWERTNTGSLFHGDVVEEADGRFIAAANPVVVVELLDALCRVEAVLDEWDALSKGESPTTARIRAAIDGRSA